MKIIIFALAAAIVGGAAYADIVEHPLSSRSTPSDVVVFERDKGIYSGPTAPVSSGNLNLVDADTALFPQEQAIATEGKVAAYSFGAAIRSAETYFPVR